MTFDIDPLIAVSVDRIAAGHRTGKSSILEDILQKLKVDTFIFGPEQQRIYLDQKMRTVMSLAHSCQYVDEVASYQVPHAIRYRPLSRSFRNSRRLRAAICAILESGPYEVPEVDVAPASKVFNLVDKNVGAYPNAFSVRLPTQYGLHYPRSKTAIHQKLNLGV